VKVRILGHWSPNLPKEKIGSAGALIFKGKGSMDCIV